MGDSEARWWDPGPGRSSNILTIKLTSGASDTFSAVRLQCSSSSQSRLGHAGWNLKTGPRAGPGHCGTCKLLLVVCRRSPVMSAGRGAAARILARACQWARVVLERGARHGVRARATAKWHPSAHTSHHGHHASTGIMPARASCASSDPTPHPSRPVLLARPVGRPPLRGKRTGRAGSPHPQAKRLRRGVGWRECARTHAHVCVSARTHARV